MNLRSNLRNLLLVMCVMVPASAFCDDFRGNTWGDSKAAVRKVAGEPLQSEGDTWAYEVTINGLDAYLVYQFTAGKLDTAGYMFTESHTNDNTHIADYAGIQELLIQKYGTPKADESTWLNDLYRDDPSHYGFAISMGHLVKRALWETEATTITHALQGDNYEINHGLVYSSKALEAAKERLDEQNALDQL